MRLTLQTDYALRVLIYAGTHSGVRVRDVADAYGISHHHLTKVVHQLQRAGYLRTRRGKGGGIELAADPAAICVGSVVRQLESSAQLVECFGTDNACVITPACRLAGVFAEASEAFFVVLDRYSLADLLHRRVAVLQELLDAGSQQ